MANQTGNNNAYKLSTGNEVQLAYLFASPLILETSDQVYFDCLAPIGFKEEFMQIYEALEPQNIAFKYRYMMATDQNLRECLNDNPIGLHFAGHGFENNDKLFRTDKKALLKYRDKGDVLIFEQTNGASSFYFEKDLQELLETTYKHQKLEFVVVASCHSECVGRIFQKCGAKHVICIDQKKLLQDDAAITFSRTFYCHVFASNLSICEAFESARNHIKKQIGVAEYEKFKLLLSDDHPKNCKRNDIRRRLDQGTLQYKGITPKILKLPTKVTPFISRNTDMFDVIKMLQENNIVQVFGLPGLGKSSLLMNVSNYIGERNFYREGVLYINFHQIKTFQEALAHIMQSLEDNIDPQANVMRQISFGGSFRKQDKTKLLKQCFKKLQKFKKGLLMVFDNIDDVGKDHQKELSIFMGSIISESANSIKILFGSSLFFEDLQNYKVKKLKGLGKEDSVELFLTKIPLENDDLEKFLDWEKIMELHEFTLKKHGEENVKIKLCKHRSHTFRCIKDYLTQHPLFELLAGQPLSLSIIAPLSMKYSIKEIYQQFTDSPLLDVFKGRIKEDSLILSLEFSLKILNDTQEKSVELFYLIGITQEGLFEDDLDQLFEEEDTQQKLRSLLELSLIQQECLDKAGNQRRFKVSPFIDKYVKLKLAPTSKRDLNMFIATYYLNKLMKFKKEFMSNFDQKQLLLSLQKYEKNIRFCLKTLFEIDSLTTTQNSPSRNRASSKVRQSLLCDKEMIQIGAGTLNPHSQQEEVKMIFKRAAINKKKQTQLNVGGLDDHSPQETKINIKGISKMKRVYQEINSSLNDSQVDTSKNQSDASSKSSHRSLRRRKFSNPGSDDIPTYCSSEPQSADITPSDRNVQITPKRHYKVRTGSKNTPSNINANENSIIKMLRPNNASNNMGINPNTQQNQNQIIFKSNIRLQKHQISPAPLPSSQNREINREQDDLPLRDSEKRVYQRCMRKLQKLKKQHISKNRCDQLVQSLTTRMGGSQTDELQKIFKNADLNFSQPLHEQLVQLNTYEMLCINYVSVLALLDTRCEEITSIIYTGEDEDEKSKEISTSTFKIPQQNKLLTANLKMIYIYHLLNQGKLDAVNGENLEMKSLFQDINCEQGEAISIYLKASYLQKIKRKKLYVKAQRYILKSAQKFKNSFEVEGIQQCIKLLKKLDAQEEQIQQLQEWVSDLGTNFKTEVHKILEQRLYLDKNEDDEEDKIKNMLLNIIEFSYLKKQNAAVKQLQQINQTPIIPSGKAYDLNSRFQEREQDFIDQDQI